MKGFIIVLLLGIMCVNSASAKRETYRVEVKRQHSKSVSETTNVDFNSKYLAAKFGCWSSSEMKITANGDFKMQAEVWGSDEVFTTLTNGTGHWFKADGTPASRAGDNERRVAVKLLNDQLCVSHRANSSTTEYTRVGDEFRFAELFIHDTDTVRYEFHVTLVDDTTPESVTCNQPAVTYAHRADQTDAWGAIPVVAVNDDAPKVQNWVQANVGDKITLSAVVQDVEAYDSVVCRWNDPLGNKLRDYDNVPFVLTENAQPDMAGQYQLRARMYKKGSKSSRTETYLVYVDIQENPGKNLSWEGMIPTFSYNFKDEYGEIPAPTKILGEVGETDRFGKPVNRVSGEWWTTCWGSDLNSECGTDEATVYEAARNMIEKYDKDFAYIRDVMGWPPDIRARKGYKSTVYIFGSGLKCDNTSNTEKGGYQSAVYYYDPITKEGRNWPCVWASYYPFSRFRTDADKIFSDGDYQREAMIHEGIHALFADMEGVKNSAWFHEAGNTWLQSAMTAKRTGQYGTPGFLDGCPFMAPFMPIECYSGWLQDGSFGGPSAEGVNMYDNGKQVCTWRNWLGGNQYGNSFPIVLSQMCGDGSIPWIWRYCKNRVLEGIGDFIGDEAMRTLIVQYRARQAVFDLGPWSKGYRTAADSYFGSTIGPEWEPYYINCDPWKVTCYQRMRQNDDQGWLAPDVLTNPGWSGANIIPIHIKDYYGQQKVTVTFRPEDTEERAILCFKTKDGKAYYSQIVRCGDMTLNIPSGVRPANNVIFCVVCNTDYVYTGDAQRMHHWDYRIHLGENCLGVAGQHKKWYMNEQTINDDPYENMEEYIDFPNAIESVFADNSEVEGKALADRIKLMSGMVMSGKDISVAYTNLDPTEVQVRIAGLQGLIESNGHLSSDGHYRLPQNLRHGLYLLVFNYRGEQVTYKVIVK